MKRKGILGASILAFMAALFLFLTLPGKAAEQPPQVGDHFPDLKFPTPKASDHLSYLGLGAKAGSSFKLGQLNARVVILEIFSMYCPYCQNEAPSINGLQRNIVERGFADKIKLIGLGAGNSSYEVDLFMKKYDIKFPLLPDRELSLHKALGTVRTPYFIAVKLNADGTQQVIYSKVGTIGNPEQFLTVIVQEAGLQ